MMENGVKVNADEYGLLKNVADASKVAPMQPWALGLYQNRQRRFLAGRSDVRQLQAARRTETVPAAASASSSWKTANGSVSSC